MRREDYLAKDYTAEDKKLIKIFTEEVKRLDMLYYRAINSNDTKKSQELLGKIKDISRTLKESYGERADEVIPKEYLKGATYMNDSLYGTNGLNIVLNAGEKEVRSMIKDLGPAHIEAVNALLNTSKNYVKSSLDGMERQAMTMISELQGEKVREELAKGTLIGENIASMEERIKRYFQDNKISGFKDRSGKLWSMDRYVDMLTRTETSIANIQGTINRAIQLGITKFKIVESPDCCEYCSEYNGEIVDIKEGVVDLPPFHPNCRGYIISVMEDGTEREVEDNNVKDDDIQNKKATTDEERIAKSLDIIENSTMYMDKEQGALLNMKGEVIRVSAGNTGSVCIPAYDLKEPYIMTHNHPNSSSFSQADLKGWFRNDYEAEMRASSKLGTYSIKAERKIDKALFLRKYSSYEKTAKIRGRSDMRSISNGFSLGTTNDYIKYKDGTILYAKDDRLKFDKIVDEHYWKYYRQALEKAGGDIPGVKFEFIPNDGIDKGTKLNKMYIDKVKALDKSRRVKYLETDKNEIEINKYL